MAYWYLYRILKHQGSSYYLQYIYLYSSIQSFSDITGCTVETKPGFTCACREIRLVVAYFGGPNSQFTLADLYSCHISYYSWVWFIFNFFRAESGRFGASVACVQVLKMFPEAEDRTTFCTQSPELGWPGWEVRTWQWMLVGCWSLGEGQQGPQNQ